MATKKILEISYPTLNPEILRQRKNTVSQETILDLDEAKLIFVDPDNKEADFNNYFQSRSFYGTTKELDELEDSIRSNGILEPLLVCKDIAPDSYRVLEGNRRAYVLYRILNKEPHAKTPFGWSLSSVSVKITENPQEIVDREYKKWIALNKDQNISEEIKNKCKEHLADQVYSVYNKEALHRNTQRKEWTWVEQMRSCQYRISHGESEDAVASSQNMTKQTLRYNIKKYIELARHPDVMEALNAQQIPKSVATLFTNTDPQNKNRLELFIKAKDSNWSAHRVDRELTKHKLKIDTRNKKQVIKKQPAISFANYQELTDFFLNALLSLPSDQITDFLEQILDHEEASPISETFKTKFFEQMSQIIISLKEES